MLRFPKVHILANNNLHYKKLLGLGEFLGNMKYVSRFLNVKYMRVEKSQNRHTTVKKT